MKKAKLFLCLALIFCILALTACSSNHNSDTPSDDADNTDDKNTPLDNNSDASTDDTGDTIKIGVSENVRIEYIVNYEAALLKYVAEHDNMEIIGMHSGNGDTQQHFEHIAAFKEQDVDVIIVYTQDVSIAGECINAADGIPTIFINNKPEASLITGSVAFVGCDEEASGRIQGEYVVEKLKEQGKTTCNYVMLQGTLGMETTKVRTEGALKVLEDAGIEMNEVLYDTAEWSQDKAVEKLTPILGTGAEIDVVFANNDEMALGACEALKQAGMLDGVIVCGIDGIEAALNSIKNGELSVTAMVTPDDVAKKCVEIIPDLVAGTLSENSYELEYLAVSGENVSEYVV